MALQEHTFEAIGTHWSIKLPLTLTESISEDALTSIRERVDQFDRDYSRFRADSLISEISKKAGTYTLPPDAKPLFDLYRDMYTVTRGAVTPLIGDTLVSAGYDAQYSLIPKQIRKPYVWDEALVYDYPTLTTKVATMLDVGAMGKGYIVDIIALLLKEKGIERFSINAGGDICVFDLENAITSIALEHPENAEEAIGVAHIQNQSICGSSGNRRAWAGYTHILNPFTLTSPQTLASVWVIADTTLLADALTTALFFVRPEELMKKYLFDYCCLRSDYSIDRSPSFPAELFLS